MNNQTAAHTAPLLDPKIWDGCLYLNGWKKSEQRMAEVIDKATGTVLAHVATGSIGDIAEACRIADMAAPHWAATSVSERVAIVRRAGELLGRCEKEAAYWLVREAGSTKVNAELEVQMTKGLLLDLAKVTDTSFRKVIADTSETHSYYHRVPVGVSGIIGHYNFPLLIGTRSVAAAIAMGNTVVLKPSLHTAVSGGMLIARLFEEAGLPRGVLHVIPGDETTGTSLVGNPLAKVVAFTGSAAIGKQIGAAAGAALKRAWLELGGKPSFIILNDADIDLASQAGAYGTFLHRDPAGMSGALHLVPREMMDGYAARLAALARSLNVGDPWKHSVDMGPVVNAKRRDAIHHQVKDTVEAGALLIEGGAYDGPFYRPTVLAHVPRTSRAFKEEIFGPVAVVVGYTHEEDAIQMANHAAGGQSVAVYGELNNARQFAHRIEAGRVYINDHYVMANATSLLDRILETYTTLRFVTENRTLQGRRKGS